MDKSNPRSIEDVVEGFHRVHSELTRILNDGENYEYEGLSWNAVEDIRNLRGIDAHEGSWLQ